MKWSIRIGTFFGIPVYMHLTFLLLLAWFGYAHYARDGSIRAAAAGVGFVIAVFACVVLHEFGHALTARRFGIRTRDITMLPIGGLARLERMPDEPRHELWVAVAGPAVNVVIAVLLAGWLLLSGRFAPLGELGVASGPFLARLMAVNVILVLFNLVPAFPMDGGRVLRSLLAMRLDYTRATQIAAGTGQAFAFLFGFLGLFFNPILLFIAFFVWIGAAQEASMVQMRTSLGGIPVSRAMLSDFRALRPDQPLREVVDLTLSGSQKDFPVVEGDRVVGILTQRDLLSALASQGASVTVGSVMQREFATVGLFDMLETAFKRFTECACQTLPVLHLGRLVGLITMDNVGEFLAIRSAMEQDDLPPRTWAQRAATGGKSPT